MEIIDKRGGGTYEKIKESRIWKKLKKIKNIQLIAAVFIIAVALLIYSSVSAKVKTDGGNTVNSDSASVMDSEEKRLASILGGIEGAGRVETMITRKDGDIVGVLIIAEGAKDITVLLRLLEAASTALNVSKQIIDVYRMQ